MSGVAGQCQQRRHRANSGLLVLLLLMHTPAAQLLLLLAGGRRVGRPTLAAAPAVQGLSVLACPQGK